MAIVVKRPRLKWWEQLYLPAIFKGLGITLAHFFRTLKGEKKVTMQYPEEKWNDHLPEHYRGAPALVTDEQDRERCVACQLCEFICPPRAITIKPEEIPGDDEWSKVEKRPKAFDIDMIRCIYCAGGFAGQIVAPVLPTKPDQLPLTRLKKSNQRCNGPTAVTDAPLLFHTHFSKGFLKSVRFKNRVITKSPVTLLFMEYYSFTNAFKKILFIVEI